MNILITGLSIAAVIYGISTSDSPLFLIYWIIIAIAISVAVILVARNTIPTFTRWCGMAIGQLLSNNNWRWCLLGILCITFSTSAVLAGFGEPIFWSSASEAVKEVRTEVDRHPAATAEANYILFGKRESIPAYDPTPTRPQKHYPSWIHWKIAIFLWLVFFIYTPIAWREEAREALAEARQIVQRRVQQIGTAVANATAPPSSSGGGHGGHSFMDLLSIEVIAEFVPSLLGKIFRKI